MNNVLLVLLGFIAIGLVAVILLQRSEGGALGMGGGPGGLMSSRSAGNVLTRSTTWLGTAFVAMCLLLGWQLNRTAEAEQSAVQQAQDAQGDEDQGVLTPGALDALAPSQPTPTPTVAAPVLPDGADLLTSDPLGGASPLEGTPGGEQDAPLNEDPPAGEGGSDTDPEPVASPTATP